MPGKPFLYLGNHFYLPYVVTVTDQQQVLAVGSLLTSSKP